MLDALTACFLLIFKQTKQVSWRVFNWFFIFNEDIQLVETFSDIFIC